MRVKRWAMVLGMLAACGCAHQAKGPGSDVAGRKLTPALVEQGVHKGKTTKEELRALLGNPNAVRKNDALPPKEVLERARGPLPPIASTVEFWNYWTRPAEAEIKRGPVEVYRVMFFFDSKDVVVDYLAGVTKVDMRE